MYRIISILALLFLVQDLNAFQERPKVCLNMIVKDESKVICRSLASVKPVIDYWVIVDTGSVDGTQEIIKQFMKDIPGELHERPWVSFEHNRNESLQLAKNKGDYLLLIDADEELVFSENFTKPKFDKDFYCIKTESAGSHYPRLQLINNHLNWRWVGVLHEYLECPEAKTSELLAGVVDIPYGDGCRSRDPLKYKKDAEILEKAIEKEPDNSRYVFYLAQSYRDAGELILAMKNYEKRIAMGGCKQEVFWSKYAIGMIQEALNEDVNIIAKTYCDAYVFRARRAEPLFRMAQLYSKRGNYFLAFIFSGIGLAHEVPKDESILVETWVYDYGMRFEYCLASLGVKKYQECIDSCNILLSNPNLPSYLRESVVIQKERALAQLEH